VIPMTLKPPLLHASVGNINVDLTIYLEKLPNPDESIKAEKFSVGKGGGALNYAVAVSRYGHRARLIGVTGRLFESLGFMKELEKEGIDTASIVMNEEGLPGFSTIINVKGEQRRLITYRGSNLLLSKEIITERVKRSPLPRIIHFASLNPSLFEASASSIIAEMQKKILITYDPGTETKGNEEQIKKAMRLADILFLNEKEAMTIFGEDAEGSVEDYVSKQKKIVVLKKGSRGGTVFSGKGQFSCPAQTIDPVDTTGAGDAFDAVFNSCYIEGAEIEQCLRAAVAAGTLKSLKSGSSSSPSREEIETYVERLKTSSQI